MNGMICASALKELSERRGEALLVDVRTPSEYAAGHVPGAVNIPMGQIEARGEDLSQGCPIVLICQSGGRARLTAPLLEGRGKQVTVLDGGTSAWVKAGFPVVVNTNTRWALERQVRLIAGLLVLVGTALALGVNRHWVYLAGFVGLGLTFAGISDICPMAVLLCRMPWNRPRESRSAATSLQGKACSLKNVPPTGHDGTTILS
jgi:rhodanese-related sulfurtransferase